MAQLIEHIGWMSGETVQIADRPFYRSDFRSVVLREPEFDALEPFLKAAHPSLDRMWRYGLTDLSHESAEQLANVLSNLDRATQADTELFQLLRLLGGWIKARLVEGCSIHVFGY